MSIVMIVNLKGGVAKTTTSVALAECLAWEGFRTLLIDADHQCSSSELLLGEGRQFKNELSRRNLYQLLMDMMFDTEFAADQFDKRIARKTSNIAGGLDKLAVLPCSIRMDEILMKMRLKQRGLEWDELVKRLTKWRGHFSRWMRKEFDHVIVDCPPSFAFQVKFFLSVADAFIVPCVPDRLSVNGSKYLMDRIQTCRFRVKGLGMLWTLYREANHVHRNRVEAARKGTDPDMESLPPPFETVIPNAAGIAEATELVRGSPATFSKKYGEFAPLFKDLTREVLERAEFQQQTTEDAMESEPMLAEV